MRHVKSLHPLSNRECPQCKTLFLPRRAASRYCSRPCLWANNGGHNKKPEVWWTTSKGYIEGTVALPDGSKRRVKQHRWRMEMLLGRKLLPTENVHHINGLKADNRIENLQLMPHGKHTLMHNENRIYKRGYKMDLTDAERRARSDRAKRINLGRIGRAAIAKAT